MKNDIATAGTVVEIRNLSRRFGSTAALSDIGLQVPRGVVFGLVGANGAGTTTIIRHIMGLLRAELGVVSVFGMDPVSNPSSVLSRVGYMSEASELTEWMRVHELIRFIIQDPKGWYEKTAYPYPSANFLKLPGLEEARKTRYLDVFVKDISTGSFATRSPQFVEIADAMHRAMERVVLKGDDEKKSLDQACADINDALKQQ